MCQLSNETIYPLRGAIQDYLPEQKFWKSRESVESSDSTIAGRYKKCRPAFHDPAGRHRQPHVIWVELVACFIRNLPKL